jgi:NAD+ diphosphatase
MRSTIPFSGNPLDRAANQRRNKDWLLEQLDAPTSRYLPFWRLQPLAREAERSELCWLDASVRSYLDFDDTPLLLGIRDGVAHFAVDLSALPDPLATLSVADAAFCDARKIAVSLAEGDAGILAQARSLFEWHARNRYCGSCGAPTAVGGGGGVRVCTSCNTEHFANPHPVVIMVVWRGDRCLLGRGRGWGVERYSALAGFLDQGESIEEAVAREVQEEVGLTVDEVSYVASQPWPFPMSLMIGCMAHVSDEDVTVDEEELAGARWFTRDEISSAFASPESVDFGIPGPIAIAHHLIKAWIERE